MKSWIMSDKLLSSIRARNPPIIRCLKARCLRNSTVNTHKCFQICKRSLMIYRRDLISMRKKRLYPIKDWIKIARFPRVIPITKLVFNNSINFSKETECSLKSICRKLKLQTVATSYGQSKTMKIPVNPILLQLQVTGWHVLKLLVYLQIRNSHHQPQVTRTNLVRSRWGRSKHRRMEVV